jgi:hypothetical protein
MSSFIFVLRLFIKVNTNYHISNSDAQWIALLRNPLPNVVHARRLFSPHLLLMRTLKSQRLPIALNP